MLKCYRFDERWPAGGKERSKWASTYKVSRASKGRLPGNHALSTITWKRCRIFWRCRPRGLARAGRLLPSMREGACPTNARSKAQAMAGRPFAATIVRQSRDDGDMPVVERLNPLGLHPTRTADTEAQYFGYFRSLLRASQAPCDADDGTRLHYVTEWFSRQDGRWSAATIRSYRAALLVVIETWRDAGVEADCRRVQTILELATKANPKPRSASATPRTSARKRVHIALEEHNLLVAYLARCANHTAKLAAGLIAFGALFALRPCECRNLRRRRRDAPPSAGHRRGLSVRRRTAGALRPSARRPRPFCRARDCARHGRQDRICAPGAGSARGRRLDAPATAAGRQKDR